MTPTERRELRNAPLAIPSDRRALVDWATSEPDGFISAGWHPSPIAPVMPSAGAALVAAAAKLVTLARQEARQTPEQIARLAGVSLADVITMEQGGSAAPETIRRVASSLKLDAETVVRLFCGGEAMTAR